MVSAKVGVGGREGGECYGRSWWAILQCGLRRSQATQVWTFLGLTEECTKRRLKSVHRGGLLQHLVGTWLEQIFCRICLQLQLTFIPTGNQYQSEEMCMNIIWHGVHRWMDGLGHWGFSLRTWQSSNRLTSSFWCCSVYRAKATGIQHHPALLHLQ